MASLTLSSPATVNWTATAAAANAVSPAEIRLVLDQFNLALANPF
jgi:hypothetical protein